MGVAQNNVDMEEGTLEIAMGMSVLIIQVLECRHLFLYIHIDG